MFKFSKKWVKRSFVITFITVFPLIGPAASLEGLEITDETSSELKVKALGEPIELRYWFNEDYSDTGSAFQLYVIYQPCEAEVTKKSQRFITKNGLINEPKAFCSHNSSSGVPCQSEQELILSFNIPIDDIELVDKHCFYAVELEDGIDLNKIDSDDWPDLRILNFSDEVAHVTRYDPDSNL